MLTITVEQIFTFAVAGTLWSLILEYFPALNSWYNALSDRVQQLVILGSGLVVVLGAFGFNCLQLFFDLPWACTWLGLKNAAVAYLTFVFATQGTYLVTPKVSDE